VRETKIRQQDGNIFPAPVIFETEVDRRHAYQMFHMLLTMLDVRHRERKGFIDTRGMPGAKVTFPWIIWEMR